MIYVLRGIPMVTMGYSTDPLDVCFGDQLVGSMNLCIGVGTHFRLDSPVETLGSRID